MQWHEKVNAAVDYIESNLAGQIDIWQAARIAHCSEYHFRRMFAFIAGVPLSEYIRRRRLTLAALDLREHRGSVLQIAEKYGYRSAASFARTFAAMHGIGPAQAGKTNAAYTTWPRMTFSLTITGGERMEVRLEDRPAFTIAGFKRRVPVQFEGVNPAMASLVDSLSDDDWALLDRLSDTEPQGVIQAVADFTEGQAEQQGTCDYYVGAATRKRPVGELAVLPVSAGTWAIFASVGAFPQALQQTWGRIYAEGLPSVGYELADGPELLRTVDEDLGKPDFACEIWIPVQTVQVS